MCYRGRVYFLKQLLCNILSRDLGNVLLKWAAVITDMCLYKAFCVQDV
jgi:hypothetical protein